MSSEKRADHGEAPHEPGMAGPRRVRPITEPRTAPIKRPRTFKLPQPVPVDDPDDGTEDETSDFTEESRGETVDQHGKKRLLTPENLKVYDPMGGPRIQIMFEGHQLRREKKSNTETKRCRQMDRLILKRKQFTPEIPGSVIRPDPPLELFE
jgi:hypothetical protein